MMMSERLYGHLERWELFSLIQVFMDKVKFLEEKRNWLENKVKLQKMLMDNMERKLDELKMHEQEY